MCRPIGKLGSMRRLRPQALSCALTLANCQWHVDSQQTFACCAAQVRQVNKAGHQYDLYKSKMAGAQCRSRGITAGTQHLVAVQEVCTSLTRAQHVVGVAHDISRGFTTPRVQPPQAGQASQQAVHISSREAQLGVA